MSSSVYEELLAAAQTQNFSPRGPEEPVEDYLGRLIRVVHLVPDPVWEKLSEAAQTWYNAAAKLSNGGGVVGNCPGYEDAPAEAGTAAPEPSPEPAKAKDPARASKPSRASKQQKLPEPIPDPDVPGEAKAARLGGISKAARELIILHPEWTTAELRDQLVLDGWDGAQLKVSTLATLRTDTLAIIHLVKVLGFWRESEQAA